MFAWKWIICFGFFRTLAMRESSANRNEQRQNPFFFLLLFVFLLLFFKIFSFSKLIEQFIVGFHHAIGSSVR